MIGTTAAALVLAGCTGTSGTDNAGAPVVAPTTTAARAGCSATTLPPAEWAKHCAARVRLHPFDDSVAWSDGVKVSMITATALPKSNADGPGLHLQISLTNDSQAPFDLHGISTAVDGTSNPPHNGTLQPGATELVDDDVALTAKQGRKITITVQRTGDDNSNPLAWPKFTGNITK
jgi:hypothetical protein